MVFNSAGDLFSTYGGAGIARQFQSVFDGWLGHWRLGDFYPIWYSVAATGLAWDKQTNKLYAAVRTENKVVMWKDGGEFCCRTTNRSRSQLL